jgi:hypothetical protein
LQLKLYLGKTPFPGLKRSPTRVHRVLAEHEVVRMACGRSEDEFGIGRPLNGPTRRAMIGCSGFPMFGNKFSS